MTLLIGAILVPIALMLIHLSILLYDRFTYPRGSTKGEPVDAKSSRSRALLVIDMQNANVRLDERQRPRNPAVANAVSSINRALDHFSRSRDEVVFIAQVKEKRSIRSFFMPRVPVRGTKNAEITPAIHAVNPVILTKPRGDAFSNRDLRRYLDEKGVGKLYVTGMAAEVCVDHTVRGALDRGYEVCVIQDAIVAMLGDRSKKKMLRKYAKLGAKIVSADEL